MLEVEACPGCGGTELETLCRYEFVAPTQGRACGVTGNSQYVRDRLAVLFRVMAPNRDAVEVRASLCRYCGLIFTNPRFSEEEMKRAYHALGMRRQRRDTAMPRRNRGQSKRASRIHGRISRYRANSDSALRVLDYGGADGTNLLPFVREGYLCFVADYVRCELPRGVTYVGQDVNDLPASEAFDIVLLCHTLEHAVEPQGLLSSLHGRLASGGLLYIEVPLGCWREWHVLGEPLTHVNFYSEESLVNCLMGAGLRVLYVGTQWSQSLCDKKWNVVAIARKAGVGSPPRHLTTQRQMHAWYYHAPLVMRHPFRYLFRAVRRLMRGSRRV